MSITFTADAPASTDSVANFAINPATNPAANPAASPSTNPATACPLPSNDSFTDSSPAVPPNDPTPTDCEPVRHLLFGSLSAVRSTIYYLHTLRYAEPNDWSQPISTGRSNEVMAILTRRIRTH